MKVQLTWLMVLSSVALGCGDDSPKVGPNDRPAHALIDALMAHVHVKGGEVKPGDVKDPSASADTVKLATPNGTLRLLPRSSSLMPLEVEHPQREPAVQATLMQFEGAEDHFEVLVSEPEIANEESLALEHQFDVDLEVCDTLCNQVYAATLIIAISLEGGAVSEHHRLESYSIAVSAATKPIARARRRRCFPTTTPAWTPRRSPRGKMGAR